MPLWHEKIQWIQGPYKKRFGISPSYPLMNDGRVFHIPHPEFVAVSRRVVMVIDAISETGLHLEPILIASMKYEGEASLPTLPGKNGPAAEVGGQQE